MRRQGFTLVEALVALLLLSVGLLGLAGTVASSVRMIAGGRWHVQAAALGSRIDGSVGVGGCAALGAGTERHGSMVARWTVTQGPSADTRLVVVEIAAAHPRGPRPDTLAAVRGC